MEHEFDVRPLMRALARRWLLIIALVGLAMIVAGLFTFAQPRQSRARADIFLNPRTQELTLDPRFYERDATLVTNPTLHRQALVDLATSPALESQVAAELGLTLTNSGELLNRISVGAASDLLRVTALGADGEQALLLAQVWADEYQALVNELYTSEAGQLERIEADLVSAHERFDTAKANLSAFYGSGELVQAEQQITRLEGLLEGGAEAQISLYTNYLTRTQELSLLLEDARALQAQYETGGETDLGASLSALAVRARLAGGDELPVQLSFGSAESFGQSQVAGGDLARFITVLEAEYDRRVAQADALARDLAAGNSAAVGLPAAIRARYEEELALALSELARAEGQEKLLIQNRDIALRSLEVLQAKSDELRIDQTTPQVSVRIVSVVSVRPSSILAMLVINLIAGLVVGLAGGILLALALELIQRRGAPASAQVKSPAPEPVGRSSASD